MRRGRGERFFSSACPTLGLELEEAMVAFSGLRPSPTKTSTSTTTPKTTNNMSKS
jgi:hypothetical protein